MTVKIKKRYAHELTDDVVCDMLRLLGLPEYFQRQTVVGNGRDVIIETDEEVVFVIVSRADASDGRNAFLAQYIPTVLSECITYNTQKRKLLFISCSTRRTPQRCRSLQTHTASPRRSALKF